MKVILFVVLISLVLLIGTHKATAVEISKTEDKLGGITVECVLCLFVLETSISEIFQDLDNETIIVRDLDNVCIDLSNHTTQGNEECNQIANKFGPEIYNAVQNSTTQFEIMAEITEIIPYFVGSRSSVQELNK
ncbi:hypothetical protein PPL_00514 [Heterostelium album PN500]|uniref:Saposin B-type domain-containing protein n=1 Tax=Heterostelium pallidum (strain ATCC 26659 / Pp 5 / PN500) TaxID=670386 RepID=D3AWN8_HETP5|nr:hypothetical protein PPL_00514 [Heterostelium album PN500]EFA86711.1 hypothetical protein PPL_00514 [Heterostelium album PN500]|eukprot:XP_020438815.1 hypothetical protein PPL_00514 [Heterostelium album PN500]